MVWEYYKFRIHKVYNEKVRIHKVHLIKEIEYTRCI